MSIAFMNRKRAVGVEAGLWMMNQGKMVSGLRTYGIEERILEAGKYSVGQN